MNKSPAYQYYPDKYECHTRHLSDYSYRIYHRLLNWMWLHSDNYCSITAENGAVAVVLAEPCDRIAEAMQEILNPHMPLLKERKGKWINDGLKKEADKQRSRRVKAKESAKVRWDKDKQRKERNANASDSQCSPTPSPTPSVSPPVIDKYKGVSKELADDLLSKVSEATGLDLKNSSAGKSATEIKKLLKKGVTSTQVKNAITWLVTDNLKNECSFVVQSGSSLYKKWDKIQASMLKNTYKKQSTGNAIGMGQ